MTETLSARLRQATGALHREVEGSALIAQLLRGRLERADYCALLRNLHPVYEALEARLVTAALPDGVTDPRLARRAALEADLAALHGADWRVLPVADAALAYQARLRTLDEPLLLAHAYVRYLGDLAGGQMLGRIVEKAYGAGVAFYRFPEPGPAQLALRFRQALDALELPEATLQTVIDEACAGFARHGELFAALQPLRA